jgi:hypothetical protein
MRFTRFDPPAFLEDFTTNTQRDNWSRLVASFFQQGIAFNEGFDGVTSQFYDPVLTETDEPFDEALIDWPGFPKLVKDRFPTDPERAFRTAETGPNARAQFMDEYLEWHVVKNPEGKITRVSFTCETTQYYDFLARTDRAKLLALYKQLVDPAFKTEVRIEDLISNNSYQPLNKWNTEHGAVHLIQTNNNLFAEVMIAAQSCLLRRRGDGTPVTDSNELIDCGVGAEPGRASDPKIVASVNEIAREKSSISLRNPVALYLTSWNSDGLNKPDGSPVGNYWKLLRGKPATGPTRPAMGLHLVYEVPPGEGFVVGDIKSGSTNIKFGGQLAEHINVGLFALACREGQSDNPLIECGLQPQSVMSLEGAEDLIEELPPLRGTQGRK